MCDINLAAPDAMTRVYTNCMYRQTSGVLRAGESSSTNLYRPSIPKKTLDDNNGEWVTVENTNSKRKSADIWLMESSNAHTY